MYTSSNGNLIYPNNHYINYHTTKNQSRYLYYDKTPTEITVIDDNNNGIWDNGNCQNPEFTNEAECISEFYCNDNISLDQESCENAGVCENDSFLT